LRLAGGDAQATPGLLGLKAPSTDDFAGRIWSQ
jgi:hypothetical protein